MHAHICTPPRLAAFAFLLSCLVAPRVAAADTLTLAWDAGAEAGVAGYVVYVGTQPGTYSQQIDVGPATTYVFAGAVPGQRYCFAVSAYAAGPLEGPRSAEVCGYSNARPTLEDPGSLSSTLGQPVALQLVGSDPDGTPVSYGATGLPPGLSVQSSTGFVSGTATVAGTYAITATVSDGVLTASRTFSWTIVAATVNVAPVLATVGAQSSRVGEAIVLQLSASDADGDTLTHAATGLPPGLAIGPNTGRIKGTPTTAGSYTVTATVSDGLLSASVTFGWTVTADTPAPGGIMLTWDASSDPGVVGYKVHVGTAPGVYDQVVDVGPVTTWSFPNPVPGQRYCFAVSAYTAGSIESLLSAEVCGYGNQAPTLAPVASQTTGVGQAVSLQLAGSDPDGAVISYGALGLPPGLSLASSTGLISGTPTAAGTYAVTATVSDGTLSASRAFTWQVTAPDTTAPAVTITSPTTASSYTTSATTVTLGGTASDNVGVTEVRWTNSRGGSGVASGTTSWSAPVALQGGTNVLTMTARDAAGNTATDVLTVTAAWNQPPTIDPVADQTTWIDESVSLQLVGRDADGQTLTYQASGLPAGIELDPSTGLIAGSPRGHAAGSHAVTVRVTDGTHSASRSFTWLVLKGGGRKR